MDENEQYIANLTVDDVPWHRLTAVYGRAADFPQYFAVLTAMREREAVEDALYELTINTEHQGTLWHATPFALVFLTRIFRRALAVQEHNAIAQMIAAGLSEHFSLIAECIRAGDAMEHADPMPHFSDLLREEYLWSEVYNEEADELHYEDGEVFPDDLFYSFYYYSDQVLLSCRDIGGAAETESAEPAER